MPTPRRAQLARSARTGAPPRGSVRDGRGLVHDDDARLGAQRARDLHELLLGHAQRARRPRRLDLRRRPGPGARGRARAGGPPSRCGARARASPGRRRCSRRRSAREAARAAGRSGPRPARSAPERVGVIDAAARHRRPCRRPGRWAPVMILTSVLLPAPFSPTSACTSPATRSKETPPERLHAAEPLADVDEAEERRRAGAARAGRRPAQRKCRASGRSHIPHVSTAFAAGGVSFADRNSVSNRKTRRSLNAASPLALCAFAPLGHCPSEIHPPGRKAPILPSGEFPCRCSTFRSARRLAGADASEAEHALAPGCGRRRWTTPGEAVVRLGRAAQRAAIYPAEHPAVRLALGPFLDIVNGIVRDTERLLVVVMQDRLVVSAGDQTPREQHARWLASQLFARRITSLTFDALIDAEDCLAFVQWLGQPAKESAEVPPPASGIRLTRLDYSRAQFDPTPRTADDDTPEPSPPGTRWRFGSRPRPARRGAGARRRPPQSTRRASPAPSKADLAAAEGTGVASITGRLIQAGGGLATLPEPSGSRCAPPRRGGRGAARRDPPADSRGDSPRQPGQDRAPRARLSSPAARAAARARPPRRHDARGPRAASSSPFSSSWSRSPTPIRRLAKRSRRRWAGTACRWICCTPTRRAPSGCSTSFHADRRAVSSAGEPIRPACRICAPPRRTDRRLDSRYGDPQDRHATATQWRHIALHCCAPIARDRPRPRA